MKKNKLILSLAAVVFAVAGALATTTAKDADMIPELVADDGDLECDPVGYCNRDSAINTCAEGNYVFIVGATCITPATGEWSDL